MMLDGLKDLPVNAFVEYVMNRHRKVAVGGKIRIC